MKLGRVGTVHFVGIGGSGMNGIAEVLLNLGYTVTGSDLASSEVTAKHRTPSRSRRRTMTGTAITWCFSSSTSAASTAAVRPAVMPKSE